MFLFYPQSKITPRILLVLFCVLFFFLATRAQAADIVIAPATGTYSTGQTFTAAVRVAPGGKSVNAVEASLKFDPAVLSVVTVTKDGSVFSLWTTEPTFSNTAGTISFGGGSPTPFTAQSNLINVTFRAVAPGSGGVSVSAASVLAADGQGTDVFARGVPATFTIGTATAPPPPEPSTPPPTTTPPADNASEAIIFGDPPRAPEIGSQVFLDPETWYKNTSGLFAWQLPFDVNALAIEITDNPDNEPDKNTEAIFEPPIDEFAITPEIIADGVQYLSIRFKNQVGWGVTLNRKLLIDTTPPEAFAIDVRSSNSPTGFPTLNFEAVDITSGISYYEMTVADKEPFRVTPDEARLGYLLRELEDGTYTVKVVAYDKAGNSRESSVAVLITAGWTKPIVEVDKKTIWDYFTALNLFIGFLILVIIVQFVVIWYDRKQVKLKEEKLRRETREIQDQMEKIFSALRDEIYDQINTITKRKRLSKNEKEAVEGLNQALEVSETLIEKEINDVKTILR
jgi:hypothetical protein